MTIPKWPCHLHILQAREGPHVDRKAVSTVRCHNNHKIQFRTNLQAEKQHDTSASRMAHLTYFGTNRFESHTSSLFIFRDLVFSDDCRWACLKQTKVKTFNKYFPVIFYINLFRQMTQRDEPVYTQEPVPSAEATNKRACLQPRHLLATAGQTCKHIGHT